MIIDFHTHCFPDRIAQKAVDKLSFTAGNMQYHFNGTLQGHYDNMDENGVDKAVVLSIATNAHQQKSVNDFAKEIESDRIIPFGSVYPYADDALEEIDRIADMGLKGVKFHPEYQDFYVDDIMMKPIYKKIASRGLITVFHSGDDLGYKGPYHCVPERLAKALLWFDGAPVVAAHWGAHGFYEDVLKYLAGKDLYFDTAYGYEEIQKPYAAEIIEKHGADKMLFGTDSPWHTADQESRLLSSLELTENERELIFHKNAEKLLDM